MPFSGFSGTIVSANIEYEIATLRYLDGLQSKNLYLASKEGAQIIQNVNGYQKIGELENVFITENNLVKNKNVSIYLKENKIFLYLDNLAEAGSDLGGLLVKDVIPSNVLSKVTRWDNALGELVEYPKYNNVALGKASGGALESFGNNVGANVWTSSTHPIFTKKYVLPDSWSFERSMESVFNETIGANNGKILFDIEGVDIQKAINGGMVHTPSLVQSGFVTELELQMLLRNQSWLDNVVFHQSGTILSNSEITTKGLVIMRN